MVHDRFCPVPTVRGESCPFCDDLRAARAEERRIMEDRLRATGSPTVDGGDNGGAGPESISL